MADSVSQFEQVAMQLINECIQYAAKNVFEESADANIRHVNIVTNILSSALGMAAMVRRPGAGQGG